MPNSLYGWVEVYNGGITTPGEIAVQQQSEAAYIGAIRVDGKIIIDAPGMPWNTSQVWSKDATGATDPASNAFDGSLNTWASGASLEVPFTSPITVSSLQVYADGSADSIKVVLDGVETAVPGVAMCLSNGGMFPSVALLNSQNYQH